MSRVRTVDAGSGDSDNSDSRLLRCIECGNFCTARTNADSELVPVLGTPGGRCPGCKGDEFEQVVLDSDSD